MVCILVYIYDAYTLVEHRFNVAVFRPHTVSLRRVAILSPLGALVLRSFRLRSSWKSASPLARRVGPIALSAHMLGPTSCLRIKPTTLSVFFPSCFARNECCRLDAWRLFGGRERRGTRHLGDVKRMESLGSRFQPRVSSAPPGLFAARSLRRSFRYFGFPFALSLAFSGISLVSLPKYTLRSRTNFNYKVLSRLKRLSLRFQLCLDSSSRGSISLLYLCAASSPFF